MEDEKVVEKRSGEILVVEDSMMSFSFIENALKPFGYKIGHAESGEEALEMLSWERPDLIMLDLVMEGMDGLEVCRRIKAEEGLRDIPVIFLTASEDNENIVKAFEVGAVDYVVKKFNPAEMIARVRTQMQLLDSKRSLVEAKEEAEKLSQQKSEFLSLVAHDLKNPLSGISGLAEILRDQLEEDEEIDVEGSVDMLTSIVNSAEHMLTILNELLVSQTLERMMTHLQRQEFDLVPLAREVVGLNAIQAGKKDIEVLFRSTGVCRATVDVVRMREVMDNLVNNAVKYTPPGKRVFVELGRSQENPDNLRFVVRDEGPGLTAADKEKLFGKFVKLSARPTGNEVSTGLGLSIVKTLVELHGGEVWAESEAGAGACFVVELKRAD